MGNVKLKKGFTQVCVWPGTVMGDNTVEEFEIFMKDEFNVAVQYLEEIETKPDTLNGELVPDTGGRNDLFFAVKNEDIEGFSVSRLQAGIRWIEDVLAEVNYKCRIYPERVFDYCTWNEDALFKEKAA